MFDVKKHLIKVQGNRPYLPVAARLVWFRQEHPDWGIDTRPVTLDLERQFAIFEATVYNSDGKLMARGTKGEGVRGFPDYIEKAETGAIGRALAVCGYGTQFAPDLDEIGQVSDGLSGYPGDEQPEHDRIAEPPLGQGAAGNVHGSSRSTPIRPQAGVQDVGPAECSSCGREMTRSQVTFSERKFGSPLCPNCQKERRPND
jgi:hypothetical protein